MPTNAIPAADVPTMDVLPATAELDEDHAMGGTAGDNMLSMERPAI